MKPTKQQQRILNLIQKGAVKNIISAPNVGINSLIAYIALTRAKNGEKTIIAPAFMRREAISNYIKTLIRNFSCLTYKHEISHSTDSRTIYLNDEVMCVLMEFKEVWSEDFLASGELTHLPENTLLITANADIQVLNDHQNTIIINSWTLMNSSKEIISQACRSNKSYYASIDEMLCTDYCRLSLERKIESRCKELGIQRSTLVALSN
ncbi:hypothetical protein [Photobacterium carnosum]|uniref:hypothetical protein n=1 Tax=Photobacterium carnosum TaxID=2023717 RepID=UPI001E37D769|nr:hypothetical protein [Photobacterium carnosum]MCD9517104.1 hypothetical protein [Photobacterium carnosum]